MVRDRRISSNQILIGFISQDDLVERSFLMLFIEFHLVRNTPTSFRKYNENVFRRCFTNKKDDAILKLDRNACQNKRVIASASASTSTSTITMDTEKRTRASRQKGRFFFLHFFPMYASSLMPE